jgi:hypothetical protein
LVAIGAAAGAGAEPLITIVAVGDGEIAEATLTI